MGQPAWIWGRPGGVSGEQTKLSASEADALVGSIVDYEPEALDLGGKLWTRRKVCVLAERLFGVAFTEQGMSKLLRRMGFSFQRPDKRAIEADPEAMREWVEDTYPALRERARSEGGVILFGDQVGVRSDQLSGVAFEARPAETGVTVEAHIGELGRAAARALFEAIDAEHGRGVHTVQCRVVVRGSTASAG